MSDFTEQEVSQESQPELSVKERTELDSLLDIKSLQEIMEKMANEKENKKEKEINA